MLKNYFDDLETQSPAARDAALLSKLRNQVDHAKSETAYFAKSLGDIEADDIETLDDIINFPILRKSDLPNLQPQALPFGGMNAVAVGRMANIFRSPGPIWDAGGTGDFWKTARGLHAAGVTQGDIVLNCFSYHWTPAGRMFESGAWAVGAAVIPAGVGQTDMQVEAISQLGVTTYAGTPDFLQIILDKAKDTGADVSSLTKALVSGGALFPSMRAAYAEQGIKVLQVYGTADVGIIAYEVENPDGGLPEGMLVNEDMIVEILDPVSGEPVPEGTVGEVVVTSFNLDYPLMRFATGDLSAFLVGQSACGRTNKRLKGWMGRADMITKVRGMFIHPSQIEKTVKDWDVVKGYRLVIGNQNGKDSMTLECLVEASLVEVSADMVAALKAALTENCKISGQIRLVAELPDNYKAIEDQRSYE